MITHLRYENQTRTETDENVIATLTRKGWEIYTIDLVETPLTYTAEEWLSTHLSQMQLAVISDLRVSLIRENKQFGPLMRAMSDWINLIVATWSIDPTPQNNWPNPPTTFEEVTFEAITDLSIIPAIEP
jgi:hypothetical protein